MSYLKEKVKGVFLHVKHSWAIYGLILLFPYLYNTMSIKEYFWIKGSIFYEKFVIRYILTVALMVGLASLFFIIERSGRHRNHDGGYRWKNAGWQGLYFFGPLVLGLIIFVSYTIGLYYDLDRKDVLARHVTKHYAFFTFTCLLYAYWFEQRADDQRRKADAARAVVLYSENSDPQLQWMQGINTVIDYYARDTKDFVKMELSNILAQIQQHMLEQSVADKERFVIVDTTMAPLELSYFLFYYNKTVDKAAQRNEQGHFRLNAIVFIRSYAKGVAFAILTDGSEVQINGIVEYLRKNNLRHYFPKISKGVSVNLLHVNLSSPKNGQLVELQPQTKQAMLANMKDHEIIKFASIGPKIKDYVGDFWIKKERLSHEVWDTYVVID
ncbi:hypothetical protein AB3466_13910 [Sphingobacterium thalpophilum]|uniref:hypothetical protein n=1 Tax=Sphingobacterium thalpophilum TaxID=259 RepID=UPI0037D9CE8B